MATHMSLDSSTATKMLCTNLSVVAGVLTLCSHCLSQSTLCKRLSPPPLYHSIHWVFDGKGVYLEAVRALAEGYALYAFFVALIIYAGGEQVVARAYEHPEFNQGNHTCSTSYQCHHCDNHHHHQSSFMMTLIEMNRISTYNVLWFMDMEVHQGKHPLIPLVPIQLI
jgi:hypothetical protein